MRKNQDVQ